MKLTPKDYDRMVATIFQDITETEDRFLFIDILNSMRKLPMLENPKFTLIGREVMNAIDLLVAYQKNDSIVQ